MTGTTHHKTHHKVLIVGGGTAGITVAASLKRHGPGGIDIAIVEPSDTHYYQPAFTLVGAGVYDLACTRRTTESLVPSGVKRIKAAAHKFDHSEGGTPAELLNYLSREFGMTVRPNHLGAALQRHRRAGQLENRDQRWYLPS